MPKEPTLRGRALGSLITAVFTAAKRVPRLEVRACVRSVDPHARISMAILRRIEPTAGYGVVPALWA
jgi:uncharacterized oligopeptide transporter (OPT) family protein